jgi:DNA-binding transcriptional MerR regulator
VASGDSAFLWETEVLRSTRRPTSEPRSTRSLLEEPDDWLTIREASAATGISATTLKRLARSNEIPSHLEKTDDGFLRIVSIDGIRRWKDQREPADDSFPSSPEPGDEPGEIDLTATESPTGEPEIPEGTMLVPLDAWNKMLNQLGNLHEAGQQLAEARERAAKAETEARFLKERLRELREELAEETPETQPDPRDVVASPSGLQSTRHMIRRIYADWRKTRRG